jgi:hypothetical protein
MGNAPFSGVARAEIKLPQIAAQIPGIGEIRPVIAIDIDDRRRR